MAGDPLNARLWADADVYTAFGADQAALDAVVRPTAFTVEDPAADWPAAWDLVGLLDGDAGVTESRSEDTSDHYAWGGILYRTSRKNFKLTRTFTAVEVESITVDRLRWPGSSATEIVVPRPEHVLIGFEMREGNTIRRLISKLYAEVVPDGDIEENETDPAKVAFMATIFPDPSSFPYVLMERSSNVFASS